MRGIALGQVCGPADLIPARYRPRPAPERPKTAAEVEQENQVAWGVLRRAFEGT